MRSRREILYEAIRDTMLLGGVAAVGGGLWLWSGPGPALIGVGVVLLTGGVASFLTGSRR